jgi:2-amino-4-hydroxy-6-hydroxymethyldihydropteridine diphosphokinase
MNDNHEWQQAVVSIGSNMDNEQNVTAALRRMDAMHDMGILMVSDVWETTAIGADGRPSGQAPFHNLAVVIETTLSVDLLHDRLRQIEHELGRRRSDDKFAPRPIDLDISLYGGIDPDGERPEWIATDITTSAHVAHPIAQLLPAWIHPERGVSMRDMVQHLGSPNDMCQIYTYAQEYRRSGYVSIADRG